MKTLKARVKNGRLQLDEPTTFPDGTELDLTIADSSNEIDDQERSALHAALDDSWTSVREGNVRPAAELLRKLQEPE